MVKTFFYAVHAGGCGQVYRTWPEAQANIQPGFRYKKFHDEQDAWHFARTGTLPTAEETAAADTVIVYTDGSCIGKSRAGVGVYFGQNSPHNLAERFVYGGAPANNRAELFAIYRALQIIVAAAGDFANKTTVVVRTDSTYARKCLGEWRAGWEATNFRDNTIANRDIISLVWAYMDTYPKRVQIEWTSGHAGVRGNEMADLLANQGSKSE